MIAGYGLLAFRDPFGIRPLVFGRCESPHGPEYLIASESVALAAFGFERVRDVGPGEAIFIDEEGEFHARTCARDPVLAPCIFEYVYLARPDSVIDGASVYETRLNMGRHLAGRIQAALSPMDIDVVIPVPDTSRPSALEIAKALALPYREGFVRNRYIGRTFIMPGKTIRKKSVRQKLNVMGMEFQGKNVLIVDDSIVRGTTSREIVQMAREAGANKVYFASAAPPVRYPNVYGIDMPTRQELIATGRSEAGVASEIGADAVVYQGLDELIASVREANPALGLFETSCFDGVYITGDVTSEYLAEVESTRDAGRQESEDDPEDGNQLDLNAA
jgi:amidophosphoribosyltransferase